ncbi:hypothetical protein BDN72DRAFT_904731 [Pluteus cervinus]|uniref:Uncharacterized protein n=1 Tax=Pluteus cervinus TaxID=181527 RepID=A0ACD3A553_9AGAR|nr:hypothetical protein BDN72DRAFT_904731 [Pluteus cervinus]
MGGTGFALQTPVPALAFGFGDLVLGNLKAVGIQFVKSSSLHFPPSTRTRSSDTASTSGLPAVISKHFLLCSRSSYLLGRNFLSAQTQATGGFLMMMKLRRVDEDGSDRAGQRARERKLFKKASSPYTPCPHPVSPGATPPAASAPRNSVV